jgi:hypothetical protein
MTHESLYEFQQLNTNCNDCLYMKRDLSKLPKKGIPCPINYGYCEKLNKQVTFIPTHCNIENINCFKHRKDTDKFYLLVQKSKQQYIYFSKLIYKEDYPKNLLQLLDNSLLRLKKLKAKL